MSKLIKLLEQGLELIKKLDDSPNIKDPFIESKKREQGYINESVYSYVNNLLTRYHKLCMNRYNQVEQSKDYYLKWEGALYIINELINEYTAYMDVYFERKEELCNEWKTWDECYKDE